MVKKNGFNVSNNDTKNNEADSKRCYAIQELTEITGLSEEKIIYFIQERWICPFDEERSQFDEEDLARSQLIFELIEKLGVNEEGVSIILHLLDQIHYLQGQIKQSLHPSSPSNE